MKTHKRKLFVVLLAIFCLSLILLPACGKKKQPNDPTQTDDGKTDYGIDNVYYAKDDGKEYLFTITGIPSCSPDSTGSRPVSLFMQTAS